MKIVKSVSGCAECPHRQYLSGGAYGCFKVGCAPLLKDERLPDWCPLPNDAAPVAARARFALAQAKDVLGAAKAEAETASIERLRFLLANACDQLSRAE